MDVFNGRSLIQFIRKEINTLLSKEMLLIQLKKQIC